VVILVVIWRISPSPECRRAALPAGPAKLGSNQPIVGDSSRLVTSQVTSDFQRVCNYRWERRLLWHDSGFQDRRIQPLCHSSGIKDNVKDIGQIQDYIQECLTTSGPQYNRSLQDLVNYVGEFLGFDVEFGRYAGVQGQPGFDGHWKSPKDFHVVLETKTTDAYAIKSSVLIGYINGLISDKKISNSDKALGIYVVGRPDKELRQLENMIVAEKRTHELRVISVQSLLSLAEIMTKYDVSHQDVLDILRPSGPRVDAVVDLIARLAAEPAEDAPAPSSPEPTGLSRRERMLPSEPAQAIESREVAFWLSPVKSTEAETAEACIKRLVGEQKCFAFGERTPGRRHMKADHRICFYATTKGVVAHATLSSPPEKKARPDGSIDDEFPWVCSLKDVSLYLDRPLAIDAQLRLQLEAFKDKEPGKGWAWFVQPTHEISAHDFEILTRTSFTTAS
jgi:hypothetical protein